MVVLSGADVVLPDRILSPGTVVFDDDRIIDVLPGGRARDGSSIHFDLRNHYIVPGFIDVHVHGAEGRDTLDGREAIASIARLLPRYGTTAFCPTTIACSPMALRGVLKAVRDARLQPISGAARVLAAHIESNFLNPAFKGAQPLDCLRLPPTRAELADAFSPALDAPDPGALYDACAILHEIERARPDVGIVTLAPELPDAIGLVQTLVGRGIRVSAGHSGATFDQGVAAISAGVRHATHLFNRMPPLRHREPGLVGAVLTSDEVAAEVVCDGYHVHPAVVRMTVATKHPARTIAVTDGTAAAGLPAGGRTRLGGREIVVGNRAAHLADGTLAGSICTMDRAFRVLVGAVGLSLVDSVTLCATTPARELGLQGHGLIVVGGVADVVVLDRDLRVVQTYVGGTLAHRDA